MELPRGTVTFLFTDIEGSTRLWEERPGLMQVALAKHDSVLRDTIEENGGFVVKTTGDGFHVAFAQAPEGIKAALSAQRALRAETWDPLFGSLRVRMALNSGIAELRDRDYYGSSVNLAARLLAAAHGGQILLTQTTAELARGDLTDSVTLFDLGEHQLRDVARPERIFQLVSPELPTDFPPLRTRKNRPLNVPSPRTPFIGRGEELATTESMLLGDSARLITLLGPGGTGKTRLAIELAARVENAFKDGIFFVDLTPIDNPELIPSTIADVVGVRESANRTPVDMIKRHLADWEALLIVDNFEHVFDGVEILAELLAATPKVKYLITSREALNLQEEWQFPLGGLPFPTSTKIEQIDSFCAVALFNQSALRVRPDFLLEKEAEGAIRICQIVGGLPLAIELAASWTKTLDTTSIANEIENGIDFLASRMRNIPERHRSMRATFEYSWRQLSGRQREVFQRISVFRGGFQRQAAEKVAGASVLDLTDLVEKSFLRWQPAAEGQSTTGRFEIHKLLRHYAQEKLAAIEEVVTEIRQHHSNYFIGFLFSRNQDLNGGRQIEATAEIAAELENIRAAWHTALEFLLLGNVRKAGLAFQSFFQYQSRYMEGADEFEKAIQLLESEEPNEEVNVILAELLAGFGWLEIRLGRFEEAEAAFKKSLDLCEENNLKRREGPFNHPNAGLAVLANIRGDYAHAEKIARELLPYSMAKGNESLAMDSHYILTSVAYAQGQYEEAQRYGKEACILAKNTDDRWMVSYILNDLGNIETALGDFDQAGRYYRQSFEIRSEFEDPEGMAAALNGQGSVALAERKFSDATALYGRSREIYEDIGDRGGLARSLAGLGNAAAGKGDYAAAKDYLAKALIICEQIQFVTLNLTIVADVATWLIAGSQVEEGVELLVMVINHPATPYDIRAKAAKNMEMASGKMAVDRFATANQHGAEMDLKRATSAAAALIQLWSVAEGGASASEAARKNQGLIEPLTPRELEVLGLMADGMTNPEIAEKLVIAVGTVKSYTAQIYGKFGVKNRTQAVIRGREMELV